MLDIVIVGAGCAGLTAGIYAARAGKTVLVLEQENIGGQISFSPRVENYPGIASVSGAAFADGLYEQAMAQGVKLGLEKVLRVQPHNGAFAVVTEDGTHLCRSVILACGAHHRPLGLPQEQALAGRGISYCAICDGAFFKGKNVAVVGGGSAALQSAELLSTLCAQVTLIHRRDEFRGEASLVQRVSACANVTVKTNTVITALHGTDRLQGVTVTDVKTNAQQALPLDGLFVCVGQVPNTQAFTALLPLAQGGYIAADETCRTAVPGVFAAGDCRTKTVRQLTTAAADGAVAALAACEYASQHTR